MSQLFRPRSNTIARLSILAAGLLLVVLIWLFISLDRSPYVRGVGMPVEQPVLFSHALHVEGLKIDCRYCHSSVEDSSFAGMPPTHTCMTCHSQVASQSPLLDEVRRGYEDDAPIAWNRVHDLNDSIYFNHSIHVQKGVGCESCHGRVDQMSLIWQTEAMTMEWCLECHREPERFIRPREEVLTMGWQPPAGEQLALGRELVALYDIQVDQIDNCSVCHR